MNTPRLKAICYILDGDRIFVGDFYDPTKKQRFHRPLGGTIEWRELAAETVVREFQEEMGEELTDLRFETVFENLFTFNGTDGHEIVMTFSGRFKNPAVYGMPTVDCVEDNGDIFQGIWISLNDLIEDVPVYPDGLIEYIRGATG